MACRGASACQPSESCDGSATASTAQVSVRYCKQMQLTALVADGDQGSGHDVAEAREKAITRLCTADLQGEAHMDQ